MSRWWTAVTSFVSMGVDPTPIGNWAHLKAAVLERLLGAQELLPNRWRWLLVEGHRPPTLQQSIFDTYVESLRPPGTSQEQ